jgi:hypothetical protein
MLCAAAAYHTNRTDASLFLEKYDFFGYFSAGCHFRVEIYHEP